MEAINKEKLMLDRFSGPVLSVEDLDGVYERLSPEDKSKLVETLQVAKERSQMQPASREGVPWSFGSLVTISSDGIELEIPLIPGILKIRLSSQDLVDLWDWVIGKE